MTTIPLSDARGLSELADETDPQAMQDIATAQEDFKNGIYYTRVEVEAEMKALGRWPRDL